MLLVHVFGKSVVILGAPAHDRFLCLADLPLWCATSICPAAAAC
jgi:hypothetical protein